MPFRTFREAFGFGLALRIYCPGCRDWRPVELAAQQLDRPFADGRARFVCRHEKLEVYGEGRETCGSIGEPVFEPRAGHLIVRSSTLECSGRRWWHHPRWEINGIGPKAPPWAGLLKMSEERFRCPGCGGIARHTSTVTSV